MQQRHVNLRPSPQSRSRHARLGLESLEERTVLSTASLSTSSYVTDHILVQYQPNQTPFALDGTSVGNAVTGLSGLYKVNLQANVTVDQAVAAYRADTRVIIAEPDYALASGAIPNDTRFADQWSLNNTGKSGGTVGADIGATSAWNYQTGSSKIIVSVMDTGVDYTHPDLYLNIWVNQGEIPSTRRANLIDVNGDGVINFRDLNDSRNQGVGKITDLNGNGFIDGEDILAPMIKDSQGRDTGRGGWANGVSDDKDVYVDDLIGWNFVDNNNNPMDDFGHGTHVAGTIGATGNNGTGVAGINWSIQMMPIKFMSSTGAGAVSNFIAGLNYAVEKGAKISNNSWTGSGESTLLNQAIVSAQSKQHVFVAAAGNTGNNNDSNPTLPASLPYDNIIAVAASDRADKLATFSNYGSSSVDLAAPGVDILSTTLGGGYGYNSGTSMAAPHVTGAVALVWAQNPSWSYQTVINRILSTVDKLSSLSGKTKTGGRLDVGKAIGTPSTPTPVTAPVINNAVWSGSASNTINKVRVTFDRAIILSSFSAADVQLTGPGGKNIAISSVQVVSGSGDRSFDVHFASQSTAGDYSMRIGPEVTDLKYTKMTIWNGSYKINASVATVTQPTIVSASASGSSSSNLNKVRVTFDRSMNVSTFSNADVKLVGPSGQNIYVSGVTVVSGTNNKTFDISFATQSTAGTYTMTIGPEVVDGSWNKMKIWSGSFQISGSSTTPPPSSSQPTIVSASASGSSSSNLNKVRVTFDRSMNVSTFSNADVKLVGPSGQNIYVSGVAVVSGTNNKTFDVSFATQSTAGTYTMTIGPEVVDGSWNKMKIWSGSFQISGSSTTPPPSSSQPTIVSASASGSSSSNLNKVRVTFDRSMNVSTFSNADVKLVGPSGQNIYVSGVTVVSGTNNKTFDISFATQSTAGTYTMTIGPEVVDGSWNKMKIWSGSFQISGSSTTPPPSSSQPTIVSASASGSSSSNLNKVRVTFDRSMNVSTFSNADVKLVGPSGQNIYVSGVTVVSGTNNKTFDISFATQSTAGTYTMTIGPEVVDGSWNKMKLWSGSFQISGSTSTVTQPSIIAATASGSSSSNLNKVRVTFDRSMLTTTFTAADVKLTLPNGQKINVSKVSVVNGTYDRTFDVTFSTQTAQGNYVLSIGPEVFDSSWSKMKFWSGSFRVGSSSVTTIASVADTASQEVISEITRTSAVRLSIAPEGKAVSLLSFSENVSIREAEVTLSIDHPQHQSLRIVLQAPNGEVIVLAEQNLASGSGPIEVHFTNLTSLADVPLKGTWKLWVEDHSGIHRGTIEQWSMSARPAAA